MGIIIGKKILDRAGIEPSSEVTIEVKGGSLVITPVKKRRPINRDVSTWEAQIKEAIKAGHKPEQLPWGKDVFDSDFDKNEWTW